MILPRWLLIVDDPRFRILPRSFVYLLARMKAAGTAIGEWRLARRFADSQARRGMCLGIMTQTLRLVLCHS